jgi:ferrochelatase
MSKTGVLLMAHGTPSSLDEMPEYLGLVRGGRPPSPELVAEMRHNYAAIGGRSPLTDLTMAQADALRRRLGADVPVEVGMRNWKPFITEAVGALALAGVTRVIGIPLAPQFSRLSVGKYFDAAEGALRTGMQLERVTSFHAHPLLLDAFAERIRDAQPRPGETVVFTAHSLPARVIDAGDSYAQEVAATSTGVAARAGIGTYHLAYQSAGRTPEPWIGPEIGDLIRECAGRGVRGFLVAPVGFVCDHTEILFDIDIQAKGAAESCGAALRRTESLNTSPTFIAMLEDLARKLL